MSAFYFFHLFYPIQLCFLCLHAILDPAGSGFYRDRSCRAGRLQGKRRAGLQLRRLLQYLRCGAGHRHDDQCSSLFAEGDCAVRSQGTSAGLMGSEICGRTVGIIGCGQIGFMTAKLFQAFGAKVVAYARHERAEVKAAGIDYVDLPTLLSESDIISLHTPNNAETRGMIGKEEIAQMKASAVFINCARGPIVDNSALADALNHGKIAGAAIDVYDMEPPIPEDYPLLHAKNALLTPHVAFLTRESMQRRARIEFENVKAFLENRPQNVCRI